MSIVPVIDLQSADAASAIDDAMTSIGFFQVVGHGVDRGAIDGLLGAMDAFFGLPLDTKLKYPPPSPEVNNGYSAIGVESLAYSLGVEAPPDLFEAFNLGPEHPDLTDPAVVGSSVAGRLVELVTDPDVPVVLAGPPNHQLAERLALVEDDHRLV